MKNMQFFVYYVAFVSMGHHRTLSLVGEFLNVNCPTFGPALDSVELFAWFRPSEQLNYTEERKSRNPSVQRAIF
ncbi:MAG TPA: hypothetical protein V6C69_07925 [Trichormus sp.]